MNLNPLFWAFSNSSRKEIWRRSNGWCECGCGRKSQKGWLMECSHLDHTRDDKYNNPDNGQLLSLYCHLERHLELFIETPDEFHRNSLLLIGMRAFYNGLHSRQHYESYPRDLVFDRNSIIKLFTDHDINPSTFINLSNYEDETLAYIGGESVRAGA